MQVVFLIDNSGSMLGNPIQVASNMINSILDSLRNNSVTAGHTQCAILSYNINANIIVPLADINNCSCPSTMNCSGPKNMGEALKLANEMITALSDSSLFIITKGKPSDPQLFNDQSLKAKNKFKYIYVLHGNIEKASMYQSLTNNILPWEQFNSSKLIHKIYGGNEIANADGNEYLQAPPPVIDIII